MKRRFHFLFTVVAVLLTGWIVGQPAPAVMVAPMVSDLCWKPGLARNIGIAELPCP